MENFDEKTEEIIEPIYNVPKKPHNKTLIITLMCIAFLIILTVFSTSFALLNVNNKEIIAIVKINGIEVQGLTIEEAKSKLSDLLLKNLEKEINLESTDFKYTINPLDIEASYDIDSAISEAYSLGRKSNIIVNNFEILKHIVFSTNINVDLSYNEEKLDTILTDISSKAPSAVTEPSYYIDNLNLVVTPGISGNSIDTTLVKEQILNSIKSGSNTIGLEFIHTEPKSIDIDSIFAEVYTEPKNAYYVEEPFQVFPQVDGVSFDVKSAKASITENKEEYVLPLIITTPEITLGDLGEKAFPDLLSSFSTNYDSSMKDRTTNLKLAINKLNGVIVMPNEEFSYNKTLGKRTIEAGYKEAGGYENGRIVQTLGGGICQISSTLYNAVVYANLGITERSNHMFTTSYIGIGKDATVAYGSIDFKFKNTRKYPIMLKATMSNGIAKIEIFGLKEEVEYEVLIDVSILNYIPYKTVYETNSKLATGQERITQYGMNGCRSITYKTIKLNGVEVSREVLSSDTYSAMSKIIQRGPNKAPEKNTQNNVAN